jgi:hypothetical protein
MLADWVKASADVAERSVTTAVSAMKASVRNRHAQAKEGVIGSSFVTRASYS